MTTIPGLPFSGQQLRDTLVALKAAIEEIELTPGEDGREVQLQTGSTHIQWRYAGAPSWTDLIALSALQGPPGNDGLDGDDGDPGPAIELQTSSTHIQWRVVGAASWINLVPLASLTGPQGPTGVVTADAPLTYDAGTQKISTSMATSRLLGRSAGGTGPVQEITIGPGIVFDGTTLRAEDNPWMALGDEPTAATAGVKMTVRHWPHGHRLTAIPLWESSAPVGSALQIDIRVGGTSIFSTLPTIAVGGVSSTTTTPAVFSTAFVSGGQTIAAGSSVTFHVTQAPSGGGGAGLKVQMPAVRV